MKWYSNDIHDQGLVIDEETGRNVAVSFDGGDAPLLAAAPELLEACRYANELIGIARRYFPKSIKNSDRFQLENTCATLGKAIFKAEGRE
jgi:hypothetical protein